MKKTDYCFSTSLRFEECVGRRWFIQIRELDWGQGEPRGGSSPAIPGHVKEILLLHHPSEEVWGWAII